MIAALLGLIVAVVVVALVLAVFAVLIGLTLSVLALAFKLLPLLLVGWVAVKLVQRFERPRGLSAADQRWLDSPTY